MGKGSQTSAANTPTGSTTQTMLPTESDQELFFSQQPGVQQTSDGNSRFSISPVSDNRPTNLPSSGGKCYLLYDSQNPWPI